MTRFGELNNSMSIGSGVSTQGNTAGTTGTVSGQLILVGGTNITLSQSTNATGATVSIVGGAGGAGDGVNIVAAGTQTANTTGTVLFDNANGITFGMSNSSVITASHNGITSQTNQTIGGYVAGNTSGTSSGTLDARSLSISVQGSLTADMTNGRINLSAPNALTTAMQSGASTQFVQANAVFNGTNASGTVASNNISVSVNAQSNQSVGIYGAGNTSGTSSGTADARSLSVSVQGSLTVDVTNGRINLSAPNALTTAMASNRGSDFVQANAAFNGTNASGTIASNNISVSVNAQTNQSIGIYGSSQTTGQSSSSTYDARSLTIRGAGAISVGNSGGEIIISGDGGVQSNQTLGVYGSGNTSGTSSGTLDARSLSVQAQGSLTVDMTNGIINLSAPNALTTAMASNRGTDFVQANAGFAGTNASGTIASSGVSVSVSNQSAQTIGLHGSSNTAGTSSGTADARSLTVVARGSLTVDMTNGRINLSAPLALTTAMASNRGSDFVQANATIAGTNISGTIASNVISLSVSNQSLYSAGMSTGGNTSGDTGLAIRKMVLAGGNNVTLSGSTAALGQDITITISGPNTVAQTNQSIGLYGAGNTSGTSSGTLDARSLSVSAQGSLTVDMTNGRLNISAPNALTTAMASNRGTDFVQANANFNGTNASGTIASNNISVSVANQTNQSIGLYGEGNTSGTSSGTVDARSLSFSAGSGISIDMTNNKVNFSVQPPIRVGVSTMGNTAGSTGTVIRSYILVGTNAVSLSQSTAAGGAATVTIDAPTQTVQTQNMVSVLGSTGNISFANGNNVTFGGNASTVTASASFNQTNQSVGLYASSQTTGQSSSSTVDARSLSVRGAGIVSVGMSGGELIVSATAAGGPGAGLSAGLSNIGNTSGDTGLVSNRLVLAGGNNITLSQSTNGESATLTISAPNQSNQTIGLYAVSNSTQVSSDTFDARSMSFAGLGGISVGFSNDVVNISGSRDAISQWPPNAISWAGAGIKYSGSPGAGGNTSLTTVSANVQPLALPADLYYGEILHPISVSTNMTVTSVNYSYTHGFTLGIYTMNGSTLSLVRSYTQEHRFTHASTNTSGSGSISYQMSAGGSNTALSFTFSTSTNSATATAFWTNNLGAHKLAPFISQTRSQDFDSLPAGQYIVVHCQSLSSGGANTLWRINSLGNVLSGASNSIPIIGNTTTGSIGAARPFLGNASFVISTDSRMPNTLNFADFTTLGSSSHVAMEQPLLFARRYA